MSDSWYSLPSLIVACTFGALAIFLTLVGISKAVSLISNPSTPDLLNDAHVSLSTIRGQRLAVRRPVRLSRTRNYSPPRLPRSGQAPFNTAFTPLLKPVVHVTPAFKLPEVRHGEAEQFLVEHRVPPGGPFVRNYQEFQNSP
jgi:hypothetical protein